MWTLGTILAATLERWWFPEAWEESQLTASRFYYGDTRAFLGYAAALSTGDRFDNGVPFHPPGWPLVLSLLFRNQGWSSEVPPDPLVIKHFTALLSGASVGLACLLAHVIAGRGAMMVTSLLGIFHFGHSVQAAAPNSEPLYGLLVIVVLLAASRRTVPSWLLGAVAGFATLVRVEFALCALLLAVWRSEGRRLRSAALFAVGFALLLTPTTIVNWINIDDFNATRAGRMPGTLPRFVPVTSYGAFNFANANHARAEGGFNWNLPSLEPTTDEASAMLEGGQLDLSRPPVYRAYVDGYRMGAAWILANPRDALALVARKWAITLSVFDYGYLLDNRPVEIRGTRRSVDQLDLRPSWVTAVHALLALGGLGLATASGATRLLLAPVVTLLVSVTLFFGYVRLSVAYLPVLWILQALAVVWLLRRVPRVAAWQRWTEPALMATIVLLLMSERSVSDTHRVLVIDALVDETGRVVEDQPMEIERAR